MNSAQKKQNIEGFQKLSYKTQVPHIIKYMGSKRELLNYLGDSIKEIYEGERICDLFAGTSVLSGALGHNVNMHSNDIQNYSAVLAKTYLGDYSWEEYDRIVELIVEKAQNYVHKAKSIYPNLFFDYHSDLSLNEFNAIEQEQQELIYTDFKKLKYHLFVKNYSGTYWSFEQCLWIDAIRSVSLEYKNSPIYFPILSSLMFAMAYNAQSTGHYAQYRDANNIASMQDIIIYRKKKILPFFRKKFNELIEWTGSNKLVHKVTALDFRECLDIVPSRSLIYADPPYAFVHYSRFYHALETLVLYDYPEILYKGRYRTDRHQSPFCRKTEVEAAFKIMFQKIHKGQSKFILSYSNTGMIQLEKILRIANNVFGNKYDFNTKSIDYLHSTMGRVDDKSREVKEYLIIGKPRH